MVLYVLVLLLVLFVLVFVLLLATSKATRQRFFGLVWRCISATVTQKTAKQRSSLFQRIPEGARVLEIGPGVGSNFALFPKDKTFTWEGTEPNPAFAKALKQEAERNNLVDRFKLSNKDGEKFLASLEDNQFDVVVLTLVLCTVPDPAALLSEIKRVLKPGGELLFLEHVAYHPSTCLRAIQHLVAPFWSLLFDGCQPDRDTLETIEQTQFAEVHARELIIGTPILKQLIMAWQFSLSRVCMCV
jgi:ubiquinone/menaquinone biosynthesis C-methylase UbiE